MTGDEHERLAAARPVAPEVYESYSKGQFALNLSQQQSRNRREHCVLPGRDTERSHVCARLLGSGGRGQQPRHGLRRRRCRIKRPRVIRAAQKAVELDPNLGQAHALLGAVLQQQWHWADAEAEYRRALELDPNSAPAYEGLALWLACQGRADEAVASAERGRELDPLAVSFEDFGWTLFQTRHYQQAERELRAAMAIRPDDFGALMDLGFVLIADNEPGQAIPVLEKAAAVSNRSPGALGILTRAYAHAGRRTDALRLIVELKLRNRKGYVPAGAMVNAYLGIGDNGQAFSWLEKAYQEQSNMIQFLKVHLYFDPLRSDPRLSALLHRIGFG